MITSISNPDTKNEAPTWRVRWWPQVTVLLLVALELCWVVPWYRLVIRISYVASPWRTTLVLGGVMLVSYALAQSMEVLRLLRNVQLVALGLLLVGSLIFAGEYLLNSEALRVVNGLLRLDPGGVLVVLVVVWMWWRGISLAGRVIRPMTAWRRFEVGMLLFMAFLLIAGGYQAETPGLGWDIFFLFIGFMAVIFARVSFVGLSRGVKKNPFDRRWLGSTTVILALVILLAAILAGLLSGQYRLLLDSLAEGIKLMVAVVVFVLSIPGLVLSYLLGPLVPYLKNLMATPTPDVSQAYPGFDPGSYPLLAEVIEPKIIPPGVQALIFWGIVVALAVGFLLRLRNKLGKGETDFGIEPISLLKKGDAGRLVKKAMQEGFEDWKARLRARQKQLAVARVRQIYTQLLELCADLNQPRPLAKTPLEFMPMMGELFTAMTGELEVVTQAYQRVRYGELPEKQEEVEAVETAWSRIQRTGQMLKKTGIGKLRTVEYKEVERPGM